MALVYYSVATLSVTTVSAMSSGSTDADSHLEQKVVIFPATILLLRGIGLRFLGWLIDCLHINWNQFVVLDAGWSCTYSLEQVIYACTETKIRERMSSSTLGILTFPGR